MRPHYRAIALDYDGTLTEDGIPSEGILAALGEARARGISLILVTGRILPRLREIFPDVTRRFDLVVAENGAVLAREGGPERLLARPVRREIAEALEAAGVFTARGQVLVAGLARDAAAFEAEVARSGGGETLVFNRDAVMVLPSGITKGTGLAGALAELSIPADRCVAAGDGENDLALFSAAGLGVAVANAIPLLAERADLVLEGRAGEGIAALLRGPIFTGGRIPRRVRRP